MSQLPLLGVSLGNPGENLPMSSIMTSSMSALATRDKMLGPCKLEQAGWSSNE